MKSKAMIRLVFTVAVAAMFVISSPVRATESDNRAAETDDNIEAAFKDSYVHRTYLKDSSINADASEGIVTLTGSVAEESHKGLAQDTVENIPGVIRVDNQLATTAEEAADNADTWISRKVKFALLLRWNVSASKTAVEVKDGVVTLTGQADSAAQRDLTTEYAKDIEGVKEVKNMMTIAATAELPARTEGEKMDDASVTAQVKSALATHRSTSGVKAGVVTRNGEVTLTGIAKNAAEKALVTKLVTDIQGVSSVKNQMTIEVAMIN